VILYDPLPMALEQYRKRNSELLDAQFVASERGDAKRVEKIVGARVLLHHAISTEQRDPAPLGLPKEGVQ
jgi:hypothetical protein